MVGTLLSVGLDGSLGILPLGHGGGLCLGWGRCNEEALFGVERQQYSWGGVRRYIYTRSEARVTKIRVLEYMYL